MLHLLLLVSTRTILFATLLIHPLTTHPVLGLARESVPSLSGHIVAIAPSHRIAFVPRGTAPLSAGGASHCLLCLGLDLPLSDTSTPPPPPAWWLQLGLVHHRYIHVLAARQSVHRVSCPCYRPTTEAGAPADCRTTTLPCHWTISPELVFFLLRVEVAVFTPPSPLVSKSAALRPISSQSPIGRPRPPRRPLLCRLCSDHRKSGGPCNRPIERPWFESPMSWP